MKKKENKKSIIKLIIGISPFVLTPVIGLYYSVKGFPYLIVPPIVNQERYYYGIEAFRDSILTSLIIGLPIFIAAVILIIKGVKELKNNKKKR